MRRPGKTWAVDARKTPSTRSSTPPRPPLWPSPWHRDEKEALPSRTSIGPSRTSSPKSRGSSQRRRAHREHHTPTAHHTGARASLNSGAWAAKVAQDRAIAARHQTPQQRAITDTLCHRAIEAGAEAFALTGSTARNRRTYSSDLDYHVVGPRPRHTDLEDEVDVYVGDADRFWSKLRAGDDFVQWTLRFGLIFSTRGSSVPRRRRSSPRICGRTRARSSPAFQPCGSWPRASSAWVIATPPRNRSGRP